MAKLLVYDLNLQPCDDYEIQKVLSNTVELSSEDEEELIVDDDHEDYVDDFAICSDYSQNSNDYTSTNETTAAKTTMNLRCRKNMDDFSICSDYLQNSNVYTSTNVTTAAKTTMNLRCRKNIKSLAYLDLRPDTPSDCQSDLDDESAMESVQNSSNDFCQEHSNESNDYLKHIKIKEEEFDDVDVETKDLFPLNSSYVIFQQDKFENAVTDDSDQEPPRLTRRGRNLRESRRRQRLNDLLDNLKQVTPLVRTEKICSKSRILKEAINYCVELRNEQLVCKELKNKHREINMKLRKELRDLICEMVF